MVVPLWGTMEGHIARDADRSPSPYHAEERGASTPIFRGGAPNHTPHTSDGVHTIREHLRDQIFEVGADIIQASGKPGAVKLYRLHLKRWTQFCDRWNVSPLNPTVLNIIVFFVCNFQQKCGL